MIEKLSDEIKERNKQIAEGIDDMNLHHTYSQGYSDATKDICSYYDAQIDAQAKTMEEFWEIYSNISLNDKAIAFEAEKRKNEILPWTAFSKTIAFYLAAGGRIKE